MWQGALRAGSLPPTARTGAISLLFKKGERNTLNSGAEFSRNLPQSSIISSKVRQLCAAT